MNDAQRPSTSFRDGVPVAKLLLSHRDAPSQINPLRATQLSSRAVVILTSPEIRRSRRY
jgi:hypothetical protein